MAVSYDEFKEGLKVSATQLKYKNYFFFLNFKESTHSNHTITNRCFN